MARLGQVDWSESSQLMRNAQREARGTDLSPRELLHQALGRAMRPRVSRPDMPPVAYLTMLMKGIGGDIRRAKALARERSRTHPWLFVYAQVPDRRSIFDPYQTLVRDAERANYERLLGLLSEGDPMLERLIDGIDFGDRGEELAKQLGVSKSELATLRRRLKRRGQALVANPPTRLTDRKKRQKKMARRYHQFAPGPSG